MLKSRDKREIGTFVCAVQARMGRLVEFLELCDCPILASCETQAMKGGPLPFTGMDRLSFGGLEQ